MVWIRSQCRSILIDARVVSISKINYGYEIKCLIDGIYYYIGEYSSEEKALKVMDMIQNAITGKRFEFTDIVRDCDLAGIEIHNVFNMPQDSEAEV